MNEFFRAVASCDLKQVKMLLGNNPDLVFGKGSKGETPLQVAAENGHKALVELLLANGADVNARDSYGMTPLHHAKNVSVAELLLANKASVDAEDGRYQTPLYWAAADGRKDVAELLLANQADVGSRTRGTTPLHAAAHGGHRGLVELLLANGADVNAKDSSGMTPLHSAVDFAIHSTVHFTDSHEEVVKSLIAKGADVNAKNSYGLTPLHFARAAGAVRALLAGKADSNARTYNGETPLHMAAEHGEKDKAELLLAEGVKVNAKGDDGQTPLHQAAGYGHKHLVELLLAHKANVNAKDNQGETPLRWATANGRNDVAELLQQRGQFSFLKRLFGAKRNVGHTPAPSHTQPMAIDQVALSGNISAAKELLKRDSNLVSRKDEFGRTALHFAAVAGHTNIVELLVGNGADINAKNNDGHTPLMLAREYEHRELTEWLRQHGGHE